MKPILLSCLILLSCTPRFNSQKSNLVNYFYILGRFNGEFKSIEIESVGPSGTDKYEYTFDREHKIINRKSNGKNDLMIFYDSNLLLDSVVDIQNKPERTTYFYKTKYNEHYAKYSKENGVLLDRISYTFDSLSNTANFIFNGRVSSIDSFDINNNLVKKTLVDAKTFQTYIYDTLGNVQNEYIKTKISNKDSLFNVITNQYEYDEQKNWTLRTLTKNYPNGDKLVLITRRKIKY